MKEYIIQNNKIVNILNDIDCHSIKEYSTEFRCGLPSKDNKTAICIKKHNLSTTIRTSEGETKGDIFTLVMNVKNISFGESNRYLHKVIGVKYVRNFDTKKNNGATFDPLYVFRKHLKSRCIVNQVEVFDENELKEYIKMPHIEWIRDGIMPFACERFNIGYSYDRKRIVIPERYWCGDDGDYIGVSGRTVVPNYELLDIPKYTKLSPAYPKSLNLYGLQENYQSIQEQGYTVVFEAQKSVLKRYSRKDGTAVSIGGNNISDEQVRILIGLNVDIVLAFDEGIDINYIRQQCEKFYPLRNVYYIFDKWELIKKGSKDSPTDLSDKLYRFLIKHKTKYDERERKELKRWQEKQGKS